MSGCIERIRGLTFSRALKLGNHGLKLTSDVIGLSTLNLLFRSGGFTFKVSQLVTTAVYDFQADLSAARLENLSRGLYIKRSHSLSNHNDLDDLGTLSQTSPFSVRYRIFLTENGSINYLSGLYVTAIVNVAPKL
nr:hypothetical transcript [Hymenolepis microstoma]CDS34461.1 hypothetical transcript [Hymenolepis microstoma]